jgi:hypothetical protein
MRTSLAIASVILTSGGEALGQAAAQEATDSGWSFTITPYLWAAGIQGEAGTLPPLPPADVDASFGDIWDDLRFAGMIAGTARKGRFGIAGDLQYVETEATSNSLAPLFDREKLVSKSFIVSVLGEYVGFEDDRANLRLSGGARVWSVDTELDLASGVLPGRTVDGDDTWVDPIVGVRGSFDLGSNAFVTGWAFVGGFGLGSDFMTDLSGGIGYRFTDTIAATVGYRWMKVDRDDDDFLYDVTQDGIVAGLTFSF